MASAGTTVAEDEWGVLLAMQELSSHYLIELCTYRPHFVWTPAFLPNCMTYNLVAQNHLINFPFLLYQ